MVNTFENDRARIMILWLLKLLNNRGLTVNHLLEVEHIGTKVSHVVAVLADGRYACDCAMGINLGIPCRHFFHVWTSFKGLKFYISLVQARYFIFSCLLSHPFQLNNIMIKVVPESET